MKFVALFLLVPAVTGLFPFSKKCQSPFPSSFDDQYLKKIWVGFFACPYDPEEDPTLISKVGLFVRFFYFRSGSIDYEEVSVLDMQQRIVPNISNYIIVHGFTDAAKPGEWMQTMGRKIAFEDNANIILMDYRTLSNCNYIFLAKRVVYDLGDYLAKSIQRWAIPLNSTRIIAHSLGAHIAGNAGAYLTRITGDKLARIDGLDPAGPLYGEETGLNATCAQFVQVLHTSKMFGTDKRLGHADFYANRKKMKQPGCLLDTCNHSRATELYYASCFKEYEFVGRDCAGSTLQSRFGFYNDRVGGCFDFDTSDCFGFVEPKSTFLHFF